MLCLYKKKHILWFLVLYIGMLILYEMITKLKWEAFWKINDINLYRDELASLETLKEHLNNRKTEESIQMFQEFKSKVSHLESDFNKFVATCLISSQVCQYFENFVNMVKLLKQPISADRSGGWKGHLQAVQNILPIFRAFDSINYLRYG